MKRSIEYIPLHIFLLAMDIEFHSVGWRGCLLLGPKIDLTKCTVDTLELILQ